MPVRRPLIGIAIAFMIGLLVGDSFPFSEPAWLALCWALLVGIAILFRCRRPWAHTTRSVGLLILVGLMGCGRSGPSRRPAVDRVWGAAKGTSWHVEGTVVDDPQPVTVGRGMACRFPMEVRSVTLPSRDPQRVAGRVNVVWYGDPEHPHAPRYGERWQMQGRVEAPDIGFRGARYTLWSHWRSSQRVSRGWIDAPIQFGLALRQNAAQLLRRGVEDYPDSSGMVQALLLGRRSELSPSVRQVFVRTGTLHIFAVSGLHVGIVVALIVFGLTAIRVPRDAWVVIVFPLLAAYTLMTGMKPSAIRASVMAVVFLGAAAVKRRADSLSALALAAILLLAVDPTLLTSAGFILSFVVVTGILLIFPCLYEAMEAWWQPDPFRIEPESSRIQFMRRLSRGVGAMIAVSVSAWLASLPLVAFYFGRMVPVGLLANMLVVPVGFLIVLSGSLSICLGVYALLAADLFNHASLALTSFLLAGLKGLSLIPWGCIEVERGSWAFVVGWYVMMGIGLLYLHGARSGRTEGCIAWRELSESDSTGYE